MAPPQRRHNTAPSLLLGATISSSLKAAPKLAPRRARPLLLPPLLLLSAWRDRHLQHVHSKLKERIAMDKRAFQQRQVLALAAVHASPLTPQQAAAASGGHPDGARAP